MDCRLPGSSVHGILQAKILKWVAITFSRGIYPTQGSNLGLLHCRQILYLLNHDNRDNVNPSFLVWMPFISFSSLTVLVSISNVVLSKTGKSGIFAWDCRGIAFSFLPLSVMLAVGLAHMAFIILRYSSLSVYFLENFYEQLLLNCVKIFCVY